jgi:hypothetical protein
MSETLLLRLDVKLHDKIKSALNSFKREDMLSKSDLIRQAIDIGIDQLIKKNN